MPIQVGCGGGDLEKVVVSGNVSYRGRPVENGDVLFYPAANTQGPVSGASIKDGRYVASAKGGVPVGRHQVQIRAFRTDTPVPTTVEELDAPGRRRQYLPPKYNTNTELKITIPPGDRKITRDFELNE